jgi:hypothetical protein
MMAINSDCLNEFTQRDLTFFKFIDVRKNSIADFSTSAFFSGKPKTNPMRDALFTSLAVLTKSAAALLVARHLCKIPPRWKAAYSILHTEQRFEPGTQPSMLAKSGYVASIRALPAPIAQNILIFFLFRFSETHT